jgi:hypothetical protein
MLEMWRRTLRYYGIQFFSENNKVLWIFRWQAKLSRQEKTWLGKICGYLKGRDGGMNRGWREVGSLPAREHRSKVYQIHEMIYTKLNFSFCILKRLSAMFFSICTGCSKKLCLMSSNKIFETRKYCLPYALTAAIFA